MNGLSPTRLSRRGALAWLVLFSSLGLTLLVWLGLWEQNRRNAEAQFELHAREIVQAIEQRLRDHEQILLGGAGLFDASQRVSREAWRVYVERLRLKQNYPGILGVGFSQAIRPEELAGHLAAVRAEGFPAYTLRPPGPRPFYTAIVYLEPFAGRNLAAFGYDMYSQETRRLAMARAVNDGATSISGKVKLVQETHGREQAGFLMYVPVFRHGAATATASERWRALLGFVYSPYRVEDLMHGILGQQAPLVDFTLHDGASPRPDTLMYDSAGLHPPEPPGLGHHRSLQAIRAYGHEWTVTIRSRSAFEARFASAMDWLLPSLGVGISLSLFALTWSLLSRREQAEALAEEMSARRRESEERFHQLFLHMGQGLTIHQADGRIAEANPAAERILGLDSASLRGLAPDDPRWRAIREDGRPYPGGRHPVLRALRDGLPHTGEVLGIPHPRDGAIRWLRVDAYPRHAPDNGQIRQVYAVFSDITEQRQADLAVRQARKFLSDVLAAASGMAIVATDRNGLITVFNRGAERLLGYTAEEMVGRRSPVTLHLESELQARGEELSRLSGKPISGLGAVTELPESRGVEQREWTFVRRDGSRFPVSLMVTAMRDDSGATVGFLGIAEDITARKEAEQALQDQARHTQTILDNAVDGIITIDEAGSVASFNKAAERIFGYPAAEVLGRNVKMLMPEPYHGAHDGYLRNYLATGVPRVIGIGREVTGRRQNGETFPMDLAVSEITAGGHRLFIGLVRDITERKRVERLKNEFVSTVSHELRTPLTSIAGALGLLAGGAVGSLPEAALPLLDIARRNSERLTRLINDLLDMEKIAAGKMSFDLREQALMPLVEQALEANRAYAQQHRVEYRLQAGLEQARVRVDSLRFLQVLANFLSNAAKFSPEGGQVDIQVIRQGEGVRVAVVDHGPGIPDNFRPRIFQKFSQADASDTRQKGGTGLGLAISKELMERMGGRVGFHSQPGQGATFYLELPLLEGESPDLPQAPPAGQAPEAARILVVEDDPDVAHLLAMTLERAGYACDIAHDGRAAENRLTRHAYAALTLDLGLPDGDGLELIRRLRQTPATRELPIVVISARVEAGRLAIAGDFADIQWLPKPIAEDRLLAALDRLLAPAPGARPRVLHVEDDPDLCRLVDAMAGERYAFTSAASLAEARQRLAEADYQLVILDLHLPDGSGWALLPELRARQPAPAIVILSGSELSPSEASRVEAALPKTRISPQTLLQLLSAHIDRPSPADGTSDRRAG